MNKINGKEFIKGILILGLYYFLPVFLAIPFLFLKEEIWILLIIHLSLAIIFSMIYRKDLQKDFKNLKTSWKEIISSTIKYWIIGLIISLITSNILELFHLTPNINQESNITLLKQYPIIEYILAVLLAPITEELVFRRSFIYSTNNKYIYSIITGFLFASVHVISSLKYGPIMLLYILVYLPLGIAFGYSYFKTKNIFGTIITHSIHNFISLTLTLLIGGIL